MAVSFAVRKCPPLISNSIKEYSNAVCEGLIKRGHVLSWSSPISALRPRIRNWRAEIGEDQEDMSCLDHSYRLQSRCQVVLPFHENLWSRRHALICTGVSLVAIVTLNCGLSPLPAWAGEESKIQEDEDEGVIGSIKTLFDPNEKTKSGKVLPKAYLKSAREVVKTLRESLEEDPKNNAKFRRTADSAKESIREYLSNWRGQQTVTREESYVELEKAIRSLASFYSKAGPSAPLREDVKTEILNHLSMAEEFL